MIEFVTTMTFVCASPTHDAIANNGSPVCVTGLEKLAFEYVSRTPPARVAAPANTLGVSSGPNGPEFWTSHGTFPQYALSLVSPTGSKSFEGATIEPGERLYAAMGQNDDLLPIVSGRAGLRVGSQVLSKEQSSLVFDADRVFAFLEGERVGAPRKLVVGTLARDGWVRRDAPWPVESLSFSAACARADGAAVLVESRDGLVVKGPGNTQSTALPTSDEVVARCHLGSDDVVTVLYSQKRGDEFRLTVTQIAPGKSIRTHVLETSKRALDTRDIWASPEKVCAAWTDIEVGGPPSDQHGKVVCGRFETR